MNAELLECEENHQRAGYPDTDWERVPERDTWIGSCDDLREVDDLGKSEIHSEPWEKREFGDVEPPKPGKDEIDELYDALMILNGEREKRPEDVILQRQIQTLFARLRSLQMQEAATFRRQFEKSLAMPVGSGTQALSEVRSLLKKYEDPSPRDRAAEETNDSQT